MPPERIVRVAEVDFGALDFAWPELVDVLLHALFGHRIVVEAGGLPKLPAYRLTTRVEWTDEDAVIWPNYLNVPLADRHCFDSVCVGAKGWDRTSDTCVFGAMLYQLSYLGVSGRGR